MASEEPSGLEILDKVGSILNELEQRGECSVADLATAVGEPLSSTYRLVSNLRGIGWLDNGSRRGRTRLGLGLLPIGALVEEQRNLMDIAVPRLRDLRDTTQLTSYLVVRDAEFASCVLRYEGSEVRNLELVLGGRLPLDRGGAPLALLASLPHAEQLKILATLNRSEQEKQQTADDVTVITERGIAVSDGDVTTGMAAFGAAVLNQQDVPIAAISVSGMRRTVLENPDIEEAVRATAESISVALGRQARSTDV